MRTFHMIRALARRGPVTLLSFDRAEPGAVEAFKKHVGSGVRVRLVPGRRQYTPWRLLRGLIGRLPIHVVVEESSAYREAVRQEIEASAPAIILCELVSMVDQLRGMTGLPPVVIDTHNIDSLVLRRYSDTMQHFLRRHYARITSDKLARFERNAFATVDAVVVCSEVEASMLRATLPPERVWVVPNGADLARFSPSGIAPVPGRLLFFGRLDYFPNRDAIEHFAQDILPEIRKAHPDVEFHVAGAGGDEALGALLQRVPGTVFHGRVEDLGALVQTAAVVVVPLRSGGGTRLKILEALAAGRPLGSTTVGAEGLDLSEGVDLLVADAPTTFAAAVVQLLDNPSAALDIGANGRAAVQRRYDWQQIETSVAEQLGVISSNRGVPT